MVKGYLEQCRHNRQITEFFLRHFCEKANAKSASLEDDFVEAHDSAFHCVRTQIQEDIMDDRKVNIAKVACTVFAKVFTLDRDVSHNSNVVKIIKTALREKGRILAVGGSAQRASHLQ